MLTAVVPGDFGKPRPVVVVQSDNATEIDSVIVCLITSDVESQWSFRVALPADEMTGLRKPSQIMVDKMITMQRQKCGEVIGHLNETQLAQLNEAAGFMVGLGDL